MSREPRWDETYAVREEALPVVMKGDKVIAVLTREASMAALRSSSRLEINYKGAADDLLRMITRGEFPVRTSVTGPKRGAPRVGDGVLRLDAQGIVTYASPNALSCFHRLGVTGSLHAPRLAARRERDGVRPRLSRRDARDGDRGPRRVAHGRRGERRGAVAARHPCHGQRRARGRRAAVPRRE